MGVRGATPYRCVRDRGIGRGNRVLEGERMKTGTQAAVKSAASIGLARYALAMLLLLSALPALAATGPELDASVEAIKGRKRVVIAEFGVEFFTQIAAASQRGAAGASVTTKLGGVDDADFQAITDKAYAGTVAALQRAGFEVLDPSVLQDNATYRELDAKYGQPSPYLNEDKHFGVGAQVSRIFAPTGMRAFYQSSLKGEPLRGSMGQRIDVQNQGRAKREGEVARALDVVLLHVNYVAAYGLPSKGRHNALFSGSTARAKVAVAPMLWADDTGIQFVTEAGGRTFGNGRMRHNGWVALDDALVGDAGVFTTVDDTSGAMKAGNLASRLVGFALGSGGAQTDRTGAVAPTSAQAYRDAFDGLIADANTAFVARLGAAL